MLNRIINFIKNHKILFFIILICLIALIVSAVITAKYWFPFVAVAALIIWWLIDKNHENEQQPTNGQEKIIEQPYCYIHQIIFDFIQGFGKLYHLYNYPSIDLLTFVQPRIVNNVVIYDFFIHKSDNNFVYDDHNKKLLMSELQNFFAQKLYPNHLSPVCSNLPRLFITDVQDKGNTIFLSIVVVNTENNYHWVMEEIKNNPLFNVPIMNKAVQSSTTTHSNNKNCIKYILVEKPLAKSGGFINCDLPWDYNKSPHCLCFGCTGSGKSYFVKRLLGTVGYFIESASVTVCDFKADDFKWLSDCKNYYSFDKCLDGLNNFYSEFEARQSGADNSRDFKLLVFDEWASFLNYLDKKEAEAAKQKLSTLLMLGRSFNFHILISQQRADAEYFAKARDNFGFIVALGNISKESKQMFFGDHKDEMELVDGRGQGYVLENGCKLYQIIVPEIGNMPKAEHYAKICVNR